MVRRDLRFRISEPGRSLALAVRIVRGLALDASRKGGPPRGLKESPLKRAEGAVWGVDCVTSRERLA